MTQHKLKSVFRVIVASLFMAVVAPVAFAQQAPRGTSGLPSDDVLQAKLLDVGNSFGWALMHSDAQEGLFIWRLNITGVRHAPWEARFTWHMKRVGNNLAIDDPLLVFVQTRDSDTAQKEAGKLQEEFTRRWMALVGPVRLQGPTPATHSAEKCAEAMKKTVDVTEVPVVAGDQLIVIVEGAKITLDEVVTYTVPRGTVLAVLGFTGNRLKVRCRRSGTISRNDVVSLEKAISQCTDEIRRNPNDSSAYAMRGNAWTFKGDYEKAIADHNQAIHLNPKAAVAFHRRGLAWALKGDYAKAVGDFTEALRLDPNNPSFFNDRGTAFRLLQDYDKAITDFDAALHRDPKYGLAYNGRGFVWALKGDDDKAIADFSKAVCFDPCDAEAFFHRSQIWARQGEQEKAVKDFKTAVGLNPKFLSVLAE